MWVLKNDPFNRFPNQASFMSSLCTFLAITFAAVFQEMYVLDHGPTSLPKAPIFLHVATASHLVFELPLLETRRLQNCFLLKQIT